MASCVLVSTASNAVSDGSMAFRKRQMKRQQREERKGNERNAKDEASTEMQFVCKCFLMPSHFPPILFKSLSVSRSSIRSTFSMDAIMKYGSWCIFYVPESFSFVINTNKNEDIILFFIWKMLGENFKSTTDKTMPIHSCVV